MSNLIISVSGLRGIVGETLTPDVACRYVAAFAGSIGPGPIVVGRDGRTSGPMLKSAIVSAINACGRDCIDADVAATPTLGVLVRDSQAAGGVQISASHNPPPYNGIKLFGSDGRVLEAVAGAKIRDRFQENFAPWCPFDQIGKVELAADPHAGHLEKVLATVQVEAVRGQNFRVLLDSNHGAGGVLGVRLLQRLGCRIEAIGVEPTGQFAHVPEPTEENLRSIGGLVAERQCAVGFCQDPDADRLALIDETGRYIGEEATLALCVRWALQFGRADRIGSANDAGPSGNPKPCIVINGATSSMSAAIAEAFGVETFRSAVGEANVADLMIARRAIYGGEGNGGPIDPEVGYVRDSFVGMAQVLDLMTRTGKPLSVLADELPVRHLHKDKLALSASGLPRAFKELQERFPEAVADTTDGLRLQFDDAWLLVRGSNTEPIVRLIAEAETMQRAKALCGQSAEVLEAIQ